MKLNVSNWSNRFAVGAIVLMGIVGSANAQMTTLASVAWNGAQGNGDSPLVGARISADGRFVAFRSSASNLVAGDTNGVSDVFLRDRVLGTTVRISVAHDGSQILGFDSNNPSISADGRFVTFGTTADNVVPGDTNGFPDIFVRDTLLGTTTIASLADDGAFANERSFHSGISDDGTVVIFHSYASNLVTGAFGGQVFVRNLAAGTTEVVSAGPGGVPGDGDSGQTQISLSADGRYACFASNATNLVGVGNDTNGQSDIFVRDILMGVTSRVSVTNSGAQGNGISFSPTISRTGRFVVFTSGSTNLVTGDTNGVFDVFVRDTQLNTTTRVSVDSSNKQGNGRSGGSNDGWGACGISDDGRFIAFQSSATNLIGNGKDKNNVQDVFLRDRLLGKTTMVSVTPANKPANGVSNGPSMSASGLIMFCSYATNLVAGDTNGKMDVFVRPAQ